MAATPLLRLSPTSSPRLTPTFFSHLYPLRANPTLTPKPKIKALKSKSTIVAQYNPTPATDRLISVAAYTLPFFNSLQYGGYFLAQFPQVGFLFEPIIPVLNLYRSVPYCSFVAFFAVYLGIVRNPSLSHYVRFNSMQAVVLDVLLVLPLLIQRIFTPGRAGIGFRVMVWCHNLLFVFSVLCFLYSVASCILGRTPQLPFVADAASRQL